MSRFLSFFTWKLYQHRILKKYFQKWQTVSIISPHSQRNWNTFRANKTLWYPNQTKKSKSDLLRWSCKKKLEFELLKNNLVLKFISDNKKYIYFRKLRQIISKHTESLTRIMKNSSLVLGKQPAETPAHEVEE